MAIPSHNCFAIDVVFYFAVDISGFLGCVCLCVTRLLMPKMVQVLYSWLGHSQILAQLSAICFCLICVLIPRLIQFNQDNSDCHCHDWKFS